MRHGFLYRFSEGLLIAALMADGAIPFVGTIDAQSAPPYLLIDLPNLVRYFGQR
jgi:hypothetical protein